MNLYSYQKDGALDSFKIKSIACLCMTVDHIDAFWNNNLEIKHSILLRVVGRIAAPLFLFILVQSVRYTRNRFNLLKRLYFAGVLVGLTDTIFNFLLGDIVGVYDFGNILFTYFYVALYIVLIEKVIFAIEEKNIYVCVKYAGFLVVSFLLPCMVYRIIDQAIPTAIPIQQRLLVRGMRDSLLPAIDHVEYGVGFVVLGIVLYFVKEKQWQGLVFFIFCVVCMCGTAISISNPNIYVNSSFASLYFNIMQCWMILALPFIMMYNHQEGKKVKEFFYWYYPIHRYLIIIFSSMISS